MTDSTLRASLSFDIRYLKAWSYSGLAIFIKQSYDAFCGKTKGRQAKLQALLSGVSSAPYRLTAALAPEVALVRQGRRTLSPAWPRIFQRIPLTPFLIGSQASLQFAAYGYLVHVLTDEYELIPAIAKGFIPAAFNYFLVL